MPAKTNKTNKTKAKRQRTRGPHVHEWEPCKPQGLFPEELSANDENDVVCVVCDLLHRHRWETWGADPRFARCADPDWGAQRFAASAPQRPQQPQRRQRRQHRQPHQAYQVEQTLLTPQ